MRIVQVITRPQRRGAEIFAVQLAEQLLHLGHEVILISLFTSDQQLQYSGSLIRLNLPFRGKFDLSAFRLLAKELKTINPDIVQANASETLRMSVGARFFYSGSYRLIYRNANQMSGLLKGYFHKHWNQWLLSRVDGIISVSQSSKRDLCKTFRVTQAIEVIPIGVDPEQIQLHLEKESVKFTYPYLIQIGSLVSEKDPLGMLDIFSKIANRSIHLVFLGSGPLEKVLLHRIEQLKLGHRVQVIPNQPNVFPYLKGAKALVMPSKVEGLPGVILEAMQVKVPVIAYGVGGIPEVVKAGVTGWCVTPNDLKSFILALDQVLAMDDQAKEHLLINAYQEVNVNFSLEKVTCQFERFYDRLLFSVP